MAVMTNRMPTVSFSHGTMGLELAYCISSWNVSNSSSIVINFARNSLIIPQKSLRFLTFYGMFGETLSAFSISYSFFSNSWHCVFNLSIVLMSASFVCLISPECLGRGLFLQALIQSIGRPNIPTPPNKIKRIQPINDSMAIEQTTNEAVTVIVAFGLF